VTSGRRHFYLVGLETLAVNLVPPIAMPYRSETVVGDFD
jgi:hypothetical protein